MIDRIFLGGITKPSYWLASYATSRTDLFYGVSINPSNQIFLAGFTNNVSQADDFLLLNITNNGSINWQKYQRGSSTNDIAAAVASNATTIFAAGRVANSRGYVTAFNASGSQIWQQIQDTPLENRGIAADASGNNYTCGTYNNRIHIVKRNSSGVIQWEINYTRPDSNSIVGNAIALDANGDVYAVGSGYGAAYFLKFNSSGTLQWQKVVNGSEGAVATAPDGSIFWAYNFVGAELKKYDASGTLQWTRRLGSTGNEYWRGVSCDAQSNVYVCGETNVSGTKDFLIAKYNSSGTLLWQRRIGSATVEVAYGIAVDTKDRVLVCGYATYASVCGFVAALPGDGTLTGTYTVGGQSFTYAATTLAQSSTGSDGAGNLTSTGSTAPVVTFTISTGNTNLTSSVTAI